MHAIDTHYPIAAMEMRTFWDVCKHLSEDAISWGLSVYAEGVGRDRYYAFEELIFESFTIEQRVEDWIAFGQPCELLAMVVDIRGFSKKTGLRECL